MTVPDKKSQVARSVSKKALPTRPARRTRQPNASLRDTAYAAIKEGIISGRYRPGDYINEAELAAELGVGRTPVNQAVILLMREKLIVTMPRKGSYIKPLSLEEIGEIVEAREANECAIAALAAKRATQAHIAELTALVEQGKVACDEGDTQALLKNDQAFHACLAAACGNEQLADIVSRLHDQSLRYWFVSLDVAPHAARVQSEHQAVLDAVTRGDANAASNAMRSHIRSSYTHMTTRLS